MSDTPDPPDAGMVWIEGGEFTMGSDRHYPDEGPTRKVAVDGFWIDRHPVTNADFARFVAETGFETMAERPADPKLYPEAAPEDLVPASSVFVMSEGPVDTGDWSHWWQWTVGANWRHPEGPGSDLEGREAHPVVHVAAPDVEAYLKWAGKVTPTEAEWEFAARGGIDGAEFVWGADDPQETEPRANTWQGAFPYENTELDGWTRTSPVGTYAPNDYGLYDMAGNVWEWTADWYQPRHLDAEKPACCVPRNPRGGTPATSLDPRQPTTPIPRKVLKGGSFLCSIQYCFRYRPAARQPQMIDTGLSNVGFRGVVRPG